MRENRAAKTAIDHLIPSLSLLSSEATAGLLWRVWWISDSLSDVFVNAWWTSLYEETLGGRRCMKKLLVDVAVWGNTRWTSLCEETHGGRRCMRKLVGRRCVRNHLAIDTVVLNAIIKFYLICWDADGFVWMSFSPTKLTVVFRFNTKTLWNIKSGLSVK